jgi:hypothetical protein
MLSVSREIMISAPRDSVRLYLQDPRNVAQYESKVSSLQVSAGEGGRFQAQCAGSFFGIPWKAGFDIELTTDGGYRAEMAGGSLRRMSSVYQLRAVTGGTILRHEEHYQFGLLRVAAPLLRAWIAQTMELELRVIKEEAERVNRRIQLQKIEQAA